MLTFIPLPRRQRLHFKDGKTEAIQKAVRQCLRMAGTEFYRREIFKLPERWENVYKEVAIMWKNKESYVD